MEYSVGLLTCVGCVCLSYKVCNVCMLTACCIIYVMPMGETEG